MLQYLNDAQHKHDPKYMSKRKEALRCAKILLRFAVRLALEQIERGGVFLFEHPRHATSWFESVALRKDVEVVLADL